METKLTIMEKMTSLISEIEDDFKKFGAKTDDPDEELEDILNDPDYHKEASLDYHVGYYQALKRLFNHI
jgi:hypothetical protein